MTVGLDDGGSPDEDTGLAFPDSDVTASDAAAPDAGAPIADALVADALVADALIADARIADAPVADEPVADASDRSEELQHLRALMVGTWVGTAEAPPIANSSRWSLQISFAADGRYEAACTAGPCAPFYYDDPGPDSRRTWTLDAVSPAGDGVGTLVVVSPPGTVQRGELVNVRDTEQLTFEFWITRSDTRVGPFRYALRRLGG